MKNAESLWPILSIEGQWRTMCWVLILGVVEIDSRDFTGPKKNGRRPVVQRCFFFSPQMLSCWDVAHRGFTEL